MDLEVDTVTPQHVCVWLDPSAAGDGAFVHALEWAGSLNVPLTILRLSPGVTDLSRHGAWASKAEDCAAACAERGVRSDVLECSQLSAGAAQLFRPRGLSVFSAALPASVKYGFLRRSSQVRQNAVLVCPASNQPVSRVLILHTPQDGSNGFLATALNLCRAFQATPIILTAARTENQARQGQRVAEVACWVHRLGAHLDYVVGVDVRAAAVSIAHWRRCSHVFLERRHAIPWWRWLRGDTLERLLGLTDSLTFLALPEADLPLRAEPPALYHSAGH